MMSSRVILLCAGLSSCTIVVAGCGGGPVSGDTGGSGGTSTATQSGGSGGAGASGTGGDVGGSATGGSATGGTTGSGGSGGAPFEGYTQVDKGGGTALSGSADIAIAPDGTIYVSWVDKPGAEGDVLVARSTDGGKTFGEPVMLDGAGIDPLVTMARHPYVAASNDRVAVVFNDQGGTVRLYISGASGTPSFGAPTILGTDVNTMFRDFPKPLFLGDGKLLVAWQGYPATGARIFVSRETASFASEEASSGAPGVPCECCPLDIVLSPSGDVMVAFRNNDSNTRDFWLADAPSAGSFSKWTALSTTEGFIDACPMQGPRLAQTGPMDRLAVWSARGDQDTGSVYASFSSDGGATWSGGAPLGSFVADEPTIAVGPSGRIFVTGVTGSAKSEVVFSDDDGASWSAPEALAAPDGNIKVPQAEGSGGVAALAGVSTAGSVWLRRMQ